MKKKLTKNRWDGEGGEGEGLLTKNRWGCEGGESATKEGDSHCDSQIGGAVEISEKGKVDDEPTTSGIRRKGWSHNQVGQIIVFARLSALRQGGDSERYMNGQADR